MTRFSRSVRGPAVATVLAVVIGVAGIAVAGSRIQGLAEGDQGRSLGLASDGVASGDHPASTGAEVSELATTTELTGWEKGAAISTLASGGRSQAGMHGPHAGEVAAEGDEGENGPGRPGWVNPGGPPEQAPAAAGGPTRG